MPRRLEIQWEAEQEAREARIFYEERDARLAADFIRELDRAIEVVVDRPDIGAAGSDLRSPLRSPTNEPPLRS
jgi:plasmid stabilization system protein ParE